MDPRGWAGAARIEGLTLSRAAPPGRPPAPATTVRLLWDRTHLHVLFDCEAAAPHAPHGVTRDAMHHEGDVVEVFLDPDGEGRRWYELQLNPAGGVLDKRFSCEPPATSGPDGTLDAASRSRLHQDLAWDMPGLRSGARLRPGGWTAGASLPVAALRGGDADPGLAAGQRLRLNLLRYERPAGRGAAGDVFLNWSTCRWGQPHLSPSRMGSILLVDFGGLRGRDGPTWRANSLATMSPQG